MIALLIALTLLACDESDGQGATAITSATAPAQAPDAPPIAAFFPLHPGDRWRIEGSDGTVRLEGVTGVDETGAAIVHGTGHVHAERYASAEDGVFLVDPEGRRLSPVLRPPLAPGARFDYELRERDVLVRCEVEIGAVDARQDVGGRPISPCIQATRRCRYPAGAPFPTETTHTRDETYCAGLGLVSERGVFRPAPSPGALAADRSERVVGYRVAEGPEPPARGCARYVLLPSDVAAACGPDVRAGEHAGTGEELSSGACRYALAHGSAALEVWVGAPAGDVPADALVRVEEGAAAAWLSGPPEACREPARLGPLLASLLR